MGVTEQNTFKFSRTCNHILHQHSIAYSVPKTATLAMFALAVSEKQWGPSRITDESTSTRHILS